MNKKKMKFSLNKDLQKSRVNLPVTVPVFLESKLTNIIGEAYLDIDGKADISLIKGNNFYQIYKEEDLNSRFELNLLGVAEYALNSSVIESFDIKGCSLSIIKMTQGEYNLQNIAKDIIKLNPNLNPILTGSLMLAVRGIKKRREAHDIDILINQPIDPYWFDNNFFVLPDGFQQASPTYPESIKFQKDDIIIDFMHSEEEFEVVNCIPCGFISTMIKRKAFYIKHNNPSEHTEKHRLDLEFLGYEVKANSDDNFPF